MYYYSFPSSRPETILWGRLAGVPSGSGRLLIGLPEAITMPENPCTVCALPVGQPILAAAAWSVTPPPRVEVKIRVYPELSRVKIASFGRQLEAETFRCSGKAFQASFLVPFFVGGCSLVHVWLPPP